ncbi:MAG: hypothetical protein HYX90_00235 [Chloroflexi bacterium]|nr:hypothetical protein [Chloroflexota bacterium]
MFLDKVANLKWFTGPRVIVDLFMGGVTVSTPETEPILIKTVIQPDGDVSTLLRDPKVPCEIWKAHRDQVDVVVRSIRQFRVGLHWLSLVSIALPLLWEIYRVATIRSAWNWSYLIGPLALIVFQAIGRLAVFWVKRRIEFAAQGWRSFNSVATARS